MYEYIDESLNRVTRSTTLNNPDIQLGEQQNDLIHQAALKQMKQSTFTVDKAQAVSLKSMCGRNTLASSSSELPSAMTGDADGGAGISVGE